MIKVTDLDIKTSIAQLNQMNSINWSVYFHPENLFHDEKTGRLYYSFENEQVVLDKLKENGTDNRNYLLTRKRYSNLPCKVALVKSSISIELLKNLKTDNNNERFEFEYKSKIYTLNSNINNNKTYELIKQFSSLKELDE